MENTKINEIIFENKFFTVAQDWEVPIPGFYILAPNRQVKTILDFTDEESFEYIFVMKNIRKAMLEALKINHVYFFQNEDTEHNFHLWIFPRLSWMEEFGYKVQSVRPIMEYAKHNMFNEFNLKEVKLYANKMRDYLKTNISLSSTRAL